MLQERSDWLAEGVPVVQLTLEERSDSLGEGVLCHASKAKQELLAAPTQDFSKRASAKHEERLAKSCCVFATKKIKNAIRIKGKIVYFLL